MNINQIQLDYIKEKGIDISSYINESIKNNNETIIKFENCEIIDNTLEIDNVFSVTKIIFQNCICQSNEFHLVYYPHNDESFELEFNSCNFNNIRLNYLNLDELKIYHTNCTELSAICNINKLFLGNNLGKFELVNMNEKTSLCKIDSRISIDRHERIKYYQINYNLSDFIEVDISDNELDYELEEFSQIKLELSINNSNLGERLNITNTDFLLLNLDEINFKQINIVKSEITELYLKDVECNRLTIEFVKPGSGIQIFSLINILAKEIVFNCVELKSFQFLNLSRVDVEKIRFSESDINFNKIYSSDIVGINGIRKSIPQTNYIQLYELCRQLKTNFLKSNNTIFALQAHSKMFEYAMKRDDLNEWDKIILKMNHYSNKNGTSISYPLIVLSIILFLLYSFTYVAFNEWKMCNLNFEKTLDPKILFIYLNPFHSVKDLSDILNIDYKKLHWIYYLISFLGRISVAWIFYQFVAAFRKFGKN